MCFCMHYIWNLKLFTCSLTMWLFKLLLLVNVFLYTLHLKSKTIHMFLHDVIVEAASTGDLVYAYISFEVWNHLYVPSSYGVISFSSNTFVIYNYYSWNLFILSSFIMSCSSFHLWLNFFISELAPFGIYVGFFMFVDYTFPNFFVSSVFVPISIYIHLIACMVSFLYISCFKFVTYFLHLLCFMFMVSY